MHAAGILDSGPASTSVYISDMDISAYLLSISTWTTLSCPNASNKKTTVSQLQAGVDRVVRWSYSNRMKVNENKSKEMVITFKKESSPLPPVNINITGRELEVVHHFKLLGVWLFDNLSWHHNTVQYLR